MDNEKKSAETRHHNYNLAYEKAILSSIIFQPEILADIMDTLKTHHFYFQPYQVMYQAILNLTKKDMPIDEIFLHREMGGQWERELTEVLVSNPIANIQSYITEVVEYYRKRELRRMALEILKSDEEEKSSEMILGELESFISNIDEGEEDIGKSYTQLVEEYDKNPPAPIFSSGVSFVDEGLNGGFEMGQLVLMSGDPEAGKAQSVESMLYTPHGKKRMGDIEVGDYVIGSDGKPTRVSGVFPQGWKESYEVIFDDGSSTVCCDEHLWAVRTRKDRQSNRPPRVITLREIMDDPYMIFKEGKDTRCKYSIDIVDPVQFTEKEQPLHPYLIGYLIGNGSITHKPNFSTADKEVLDMFDLLIPDGYKIEHAAEYDYRIVKVLRNNQPNIVWEILNDLHLAGKSSHYKFIPSIYKYGSVSQRQWLLQGLMDSDGYVTKNKAYYEYTTVSPRLAHDFAELVRSFGARCRVVQKETKHTHNGEVKCSKAYRITFSMKDNGITPVSLERKRRDIKPREKVLYKYIREVKPMGMQPMQCISVEASDHLYVTDDFTLTHNTILTLQILKNVSEYAPAVMFAFEFTTRSLVKMQKKTEGEKYRNDNLILIDKGYDIADIERKIKKWKRKGARFFVIDSQMRITNENAIGYTMEERETEKFSRLAKLAHKEDLLIMLIIQNSKADAAASVISPMGSKKGAHEASIIMHLKRDKITADTSDEDKEKREFILNKNKQTGQHFIKPVKLNPYDLKFRRLYGEGESETRTYDGHKKPIPVEHKDSSGKTTKKQTFEEALQELDNSDKIDMAHI